MRRTVNSEAEGLVWGQAVLRSLVYLRSPAVEVNGGVKGGEGWASYKATAGVQAIDAIGCRMEVERSGWNSYIFLRENCCIW